MLWARWSFSDQNFALPFPISCRPAIFFPCATCLLLLRLNLSPEHSKLESFCVSLKWIWCHHDAALEPQGAECLFPRMGPCQRPCSQAPSRERGLCRRPVAGNGAAEEGTFPGTGSLQRPCSQERPPCRGLVPGNRAFAEGLFPGNAEGLFPGTPPLQRVCSRKRSRARAPKGPSKKHIYKIRMTHTVETPPPILGSHFNRGNVPERWGRPRFAMQCSSLAVETMFPQPKLGISMQFGLAFNRGNDSERWGNHAFYTFVSTARLPRIFQTCKSSRRGPEKKTCAQNWHLKNFCRFCNASRGVAIPYAEGMKPPNLSPNDPSEAPNLKQHSITKTSFSILMLNCKPKQKEITICQKDSFRYRYMPQFLRFFSINMLSTKG